MGKILVARDLRKEGTHSEQWVWEQIRNRKVLGYKFKRQHVLLGFVADFYCPELNLALEIDGKVHDTQREYDRLRQEIIEDQGIEFLRIRVEEIKDVIPTIVHWIENRGKS